MINFGAGKLIAVPTNDSTGASISNPTPVILGTMQDVSVDISVDLKTLYGAKRYPVAVGQGKGKIEVKAKYAEIDGGVIGSLFYGKTASNNIRAVSMDNAVAVPSTPFQVTVTPPSSGTFVADMGVFNSSTGAQLTRVAASPTAGQYAVSAGGQYTFAAADTGKNMLISYEYVVATGGTTFSLTNDLMGSTPSFAMILQNSYGGQNLVCKFNKAVSGQLSVPLKNDDFAIYDFNAECFSDSSGNLGYICIF